MSNLLSNLLGSLISTVEAQSAVAGGGTPGAGGGTLTNTGTNIALSLLVGGALIFTVLLVLFSRRKKQKAE